MPTTVEELKETVREQRFKLRAIGVLLDHCLEHTRAKVRCEVQAALWDLVLHTRGEKPLRFVFGDKTVEE